MKKTASVVLSILGIGAFVFGSFMANKATQGEERISQAEENIDGSRKPLIGPIRKSVRANATETAQEKLSDAKQGVVRFQLTGYWLRGIGVVVFVVGAICFIFSCRKRKI